MSFAQCNEERLRNLLKFLLITFLYYYLLMLLLDFYIFNNLILLIIGLLVLTFLIVCIISLYRLLKSNDVLTVMTKLFAFIIIAIIVYLANNQWCYLALIFLLASNLGLINEDMISAIAAYRGKKPYIKEIKTTEQHYEKQQKNEEKVKEYNQYTVSEPQTSSAEYAKYLRDGIIKYHTVEKDILSWFCNYKNLCFCENLILSNKNSEQLYPDGIIQAKQKDTILEIKQLKSIKYMYSALHSVNFLYNKYEKIYDKSSKSFEFIVAIIVDNYNENDIHAFTKNCKYYDFRIYLFVDNNGEVENKAIM